MRLPDTDLVPVLTIVAGGAIGVLLTLGPLVVLSAPGPVPVLEPVELSLSAPSALPTESPAEVVVEAIEETIEAVITVWPYDVRSSGLVVLPEETFWVVLPNYNGGSAHGGDDRLIVVLQDPVTRQGFADGFWPVIVKMPLADARNRHADLAREISRRPLAKNEIEGMESLIGTAVYSLDHNGQTRLYPEAAFQVLPGYVGVHRQGEMSLEQSRDGRRYIRLSPFHGQMIDLAKSENQVDDRLTVVLYDAARSFWPVMVKMDSGIARAFLADLAWVIEGKCDGG